MSDNRVIVIGAGAGGMIAAGRAGECGAETLLLEKTARTGNKLLISGEYRCNLSNTRNLDDFITAYGPQGRFLYHAFDLFFRDELRQLLRRFGVETIAEADGRIFPASNSSVDVLKAFESYLSESKVRLETQKEVDSIQVANGRITGVKIGQTAYEAGAVVIATGGASYPATGSTGAGYRMAAAQGHRIVRLRPALVPLAVCENELVKKMQGVSLAGVRLTAFNCEAGDVPPPASPLKDAGRGISGKNPRPPLIESRMGDVIFTHFGLSGPATLLMSLAVVNALEQGPVSVAIDLRPNLTWEDTRRDLQERFDHFSKRTFRNILLELLPPRLIDPFLAMSAVAAEKTGSQINASDRERLVRLLKSLNFNVKGPMPLASAMVTAGGISLDKIEPRTMASRLIKGLYFCGEVMDIDADTGGL